MDDCPDAFARALGEYVVACGQLEQVVASSIKRLRGLELLEGLRLAERTGSFRNQRRLMRRAFLESHPEPDDALRQLDRLLNGIGEAFDHRNREIHSTAIYYGRARRPMRLTSPEPRAARTFDLSLDAVRLRGMRDQIHSLRDELNAFTLRLGRPR